MSFKTLSHIFSPFKNIASSPLVVAMLLYAFYCDTALGKIGETQDAMIQRFGEPKIKNKLRYYYKINDCRVEALFTDDGTCYMETFYLSGAKLYRLDDKEKLKK
jgi:hypothetical protein